MKRKLFVSILTTVMALCVSSGAQADDGDVYHNPVIKWSLPDPTVIKADNGYFYLYATEDTHNVPIYRSKDLVTWRYAGTAFTDATRPMDFVPKGGIWAPDINYINGQYVLYYSKSEWGKTWECGIGVAVSDRPNGGFHDAHKLFISSEVGIENCIDPFFISDESGNYLFWGSFHDIYGVQLTDDGLEIKEGAVPQKIAGGLIEATMIVKHNGYYYLIGSAGSCCEGANSTYRLVVARSKNLFGPYVDRNGRSAIGDNFSPLLNKSPEVFGPGHCSEFVTDDAGQTWVLYHGYQANDVDAGRVVYLDKVTWGSDGWPQVQGMRPSTESEAPIFNDETGVLEKKTTGNNGYLINQCDGGYFRIDSPDDNPFAWQLYNGEGHLLMNGEGRNMAVVDTSSIRNGLYIIRVSGTAGSLCEKMLRH
ncbi:MAG: family 43 glycosylhydrolase [Prevotella sp.]|nr:family 43 glycosylhydrolase [Prevotella sp.]